MTVSPRTLPAFIDAAADRIAREIARLRAEAERERQLRDAELRARSAELDARLGAVAELERRLQARLDSLADGERGETGERGAAGERGEKGEQGEAGRGIDDLAVTLDGATVELAFTIGDATERFELELPAGQQGERGEPGEKGDAGALPAAKAWEDRVHYCGEIAVHEGSTWQAVRDSGHAPPHEDWACLARAGADGRDGASWNPRGLWLADGEYAALDVAMLNGSSFVALRDNPGPCPGEGWKLVAAPGKRGEKGERGAAGERGPAGPAVREMAIGDDAMLTLVNADGSQVRCDLYPLLAKIDRGRA